MVSIDIGLSTLAVFVPASIALILAPGPDSLYVLTRSIGGGQRNGFASALGTSTGILVHTTAAVLGLSAILRTSALAYTVVKYAGALYLLYLGVQTIRHKEDFDLQVDDADTDAEADSGGGVGGEISTDVDTVESYRRGVVINVLNPKVAVFFLAFLPQFVTPGAGAWLDMSLLGVTFTVLTMCYLGTLALVSSRVKAVLTNRPRVTDAIRWAAGSVIIGFGIELAIGERVSG